jgi:coenzyme F420-0:L-glutamate ligase/coenzyme F420-1:gamma-L-glutamate ligase
MELFSVKLPIIQPNEDLLQIILDIFKEKNIILNDKDIIVISEKIIATAQGRVVDLSRVKKVSDQAKELALKYKMDKRIVNLILKEASMILGGIDTVLLAEVNGLLIANAGIDHSNSGGENFVVLLPENPQQTINEYRNFFMRTFNLKHLGVILSDSRVQPLKKGTIGVAIAVSGFEPIEDCRGRADLFGRPLQITQRAIADNLVSAAQILLGEADEQTPIVIIKGAPVIFIDKPPSSMQMAPEECLYMNIFAQYLLKKNYKKND